MKYSPRALLEQYLKKNGLIMTLVVMTGAIKSILNIFLSLLVGVFYSIHFGDTTGKSELLGSFGVKISDVNILFTWFTVVLLFRIVVGAMAYYIENRSGDKFVQHLRNLLYEHQLRKKLVPQDSVASSRSLLKQSTEMNSARSFLVKGILVFTSDLMFLAGSLVLMTLLSPELSILSAKVLVIAVLISLLLGLFLRKAIQKKNDKRLDLLGTAESGFRNLKAIKLLNRERLEIDQFVRKNERYVSSTMELHFRNSLIEGWLPAVFFGLLGVIMWNVSVDPSLSDTVSGGKLITFVLLLFYMQSSIRRMLKTPGLWQKGLISFKSLAKELNSPIERKINEDIDRNSKGLIQMQNVSFGYSSTNLLFKDLNLSILGTGLTCIVGNPGSGKSTLLKLLTKLYDPFAGEITIDGVQYSTLTAFGVRKKISILSSEIPLLGKTIFEAISFSQKEDKREEALKTLAELGVITPSNKADILEERLNNIQSKWTLRRLELARALLTRKNIILMDEPFEGLANDERSELVKIINRLSYFKTVIIACRKPEDGLLVHKKIELR